LVILKKGFKIMLPTAFILLAAIFANGCATVKTQAELVAIVQSEKNPMKLFDYARKNPYSSVCRLATERLLELGHHVLLGKLMNISSDAEVQRIVISGVADEGMVWETAYNRDRAQVVRDAAAIRINDPIALAELFVERLASPEVVIPRLTKEMFLRQDIKRRLDETIKNRSEKPVIRGAAFMALEDVDMLCETETQIGIADFLMCWQPIDGQITPGMRAKAKLDLVDENALFLLVFSTSDNDLLNHCVKCIDDNGKLEKIKNDHKDVRIQAQAAEKLNRRR